ncbi:MAG: GNAT family N-acetyltransferase [Acidobacteria bacterium]|nr:GNAT family N-acetyltransferase [Acidobacteriota bacterium]
MPHWIDRRGIRVYRYRSVIRSCRTASLSDVSIDTLEEYSGRGLAARAARTLVRQMRRSGKAPVWGALSSDYASLAVARRLGFEEAGRLSVFDQGL